MPSVTAKRQCPDLIFVKPRFEVYKAISQQIREIFAEHTPIIEPLSLDEAYLDVTENLQGHSAGDATSRSRSARRSRMKPASTPRPASPTTSSWRSSPPTTANPNGQYVITPEMGPAFVEKLPVGKFHGIGPATVAKMNALGLYTGLDMRNQSLDFLQANFGKAGTYYYWISRGVDERDVRANRIRKSVGAENTFSADLTEFDAMVAANLQPLIDKVWRHCEVDGHPGANGHAQSEVHRLRDHHAQPIRVCGCREPGRSRPSGDRLAGRRHAPSKTSAPPGSVTVFSARRERPEAATGFRDLN